MSSQEQLDAKRRRVSRACDTCRRKKVRCDGLQPSCTNCTTFGFQCTFNDSAKKRGPPKGYIEALENRLHRMENLLGGLVQTGDRPKADLDSWKEEEDDDLDSADAAWVPHSPDTPLVPALSSHHSSSESALSESKGLGSDSMASPDPDFDILPYDRDARKKINELSDNMDAMTLDDGGFIKYLGNSSGIDLLQKNQILKNGHVMVPVQMKEHQKWLVEKDAAVQQMASEMPLPPKDLAEHLLDCCWSYVHPHMPVLHKPTFMRQYRNPDPEKRPAHVLIISMFAVASRYSDHPEITGHGHDPEEFGDEYFSRAKRLVDYEYELPRQSTIQALLLMVVYRFTSAKSGGRVWVMLGMATRMAQDLGMHRNSSRWHLPPLETEIRKRLWWACYVLDRWCSASMGRPLAIDDNDCDVDLPSAVEQDWADADGNAASPHENNDKVKEESSFALRYFVETIKLSNILGQILQRVYAAKTRTHGPARVSSTVAELDTTLTKWLLALPPDLRYNHQAVAAGTAKVSQWVATIHSFYYVVLILLHRPYMVPTSPTKAKISESMPSLNICISAANSITYLTGKMAEDGTLKHAWNFTTYELFTSSLIHLTNSASMDIRLQAQARDNFVKNMAYMKILGARWFNAAKFGMALEDLMCAHLNFDEYKPEGRSMEPVTIAKMGDDAGTKYPIILRDVHHPSGGSLLFAPKGFGAPQTPSSTVSTPTSSPSNSTIPHPEATDTKQDAGDSDLSCSRDSSMEPTANSTPPQSRPMKKNRKPASQRNSLLYAAQCSAPSPPSSGAPPTAAIPDQPSFTFASLSTPGMFVQGQAFMDYEQMMAQQQELQQLQQQQQQQQQHQQQQSQPALPAVFTANPLFSCPYALQDRTAQQSGNLASALQSQQQKQQSLQQQQQQPQAQSFLPLQPLEQQNLYAVGLSSQPTPERQTSNGSDFSNSGLSTIDAAAAYNFSSNGLQSGPTSAIPSGPVDYSTLSLFPQQDNGTQDANMVAVPNPFCGMPSTIDWDEWNQYIATAGLQKF
ncbi:hypothetical protein BGZ70_005467 [Mortierella alpina]|uniref:Zn(2)-C6 fungal-type domain-containing protein n=1 Tax=Mortierella alpina TaxID=64518 RepID=A0A9P6J964_MORAP|nr:hypothetical protein BGZ70_005467 [Mortierella alpina]